MAKLQDEIVAEYGADGAPPKPVRKGRGRATLRPEVMDGDEFGDLWRRIKQKTRYRVRIQESDSAQLIERVAEALSKMSFAPPRLRVVKAGVDVEVTEDGTASEFVAHQTSRARAVALQATARALPNLVALIEELLARATPATRISRRTILGILRALPDPSIAPVNPQEFATAAVQEVRRTLSRLIVDGIVYEKTGDNYDMAQVWGEDEIDLFGLCNPVDDGSGKSPYDRVACDSKIEQGIARDLQFRDDVTLFVKLPRGFVVPTPVGDYNPDWAVVIEREGAGPRLYMICESKGDPDQLRPDEKMKTECGKARFTGLDDQLEFKIVASAAEIP